jgi:ATP-dependent helicase HrpA
VAQSRDLVGLFEPHGAAARTLFARSAPSATWERAGITSWDFGELPEFIVRRVGGAELRAYPALIDREKSVDLCLLESAQAAAAATRLGVRRLFALALRHALSTFAARCPAPFARQAGLPASRAEKEAFRGVFLARVLDEAFACSDGARVLRNKTEFDAALALGVPRMAPACTRVERAVVAASAELQNTLRALAAAANQPSGTAARAEISAQIELLFPPDLLSEVELARLEQFPRYLRAAQARLARAITDPRKDADKLKPFAPLWQKFLLARAPARDRDAECALRWSFEELRVAIFAPELKPALPVTVGSVALALEALR